MSMTFDDFRKLVQKMRAAQKAYYTNRTQGNLVRAKELEREVDRVIKAHESAENFEKLAQEIDDQYGLFEQEEG